jgi:hypothetical protein
MSKRGMFWGIPYDWRRPSLSRMRERVWNPNDRRLFTPKSFGWGYTINLYELMRRIRGER